MSRSSPPSFSGFGLGMQPPYKLGLPRTLLPNPRSTRTTGLGKGSGATSVLRRSDLFRRILSPGAVRYSGCRKTMFPSNSGRCGRRGFGGWTLTIELKYRLNCHFVFGRAALRGSTGWVGGPSCRCGNSWPGVFGPLFVGVGRRAAPRIVQERISMERRKPRDRVSWNC